MAGDRTGTARDIAFFAALMATALALGGALAHAYEYFNKMQMSGTNYFVTQQAYSGWNQLAYVLMVQLIGILALVFVYRSERRVLFPVLMALGGWLLAQAIFWTWTFPANQATEQWTVQPENWAALRAQWENSHFAGAVCQLITMGALVVAVLRR